MYGLALVPSLSLYATWGDLREEETLPNTVGLVGNTCALVSTCSTLEKSAVYTCQTKLF